MVGWNHLAYCETFIVFSSPWIYTSQSSHTFLPRFTLWIYEGWWPGCPETGGHIYCPGASIHRDQFTVMLIAVYWCLLMFFPECLIEDIEAPSYVGHMPILPQFQCIVIPRTTPSWLYDVWPCWFLKSTPFLLVKSSQILIFHKIDFEWTTLWQFVT